MDNKVAILATMAALSAAFIIEALHNLVAVIGKGRPDFLSATCRHKN